MKASKTRISGEHFTRHKVSFLSTIHQWNPKKQFIVEKGEALWPAFEIWVVRFEESTEGISHVELLMAAFGSTSALQTISNSALLRSLCAARKIWL